MTARAVSHQSARGMHALAAGALEAAGLRSERRACLPGTATVSTSGTWTSRLNSWQRAVAAFKTCDVSAKRQCLRRAGMAGPELLRSCDERVEHSVNKVGPRVFAPHVDTQCVRQHFGVIKKFPQIKQLSGALSRGGPVDVKDGGNIEAELAYGNQSSVAPHSSKILEKTISDVVLGRALVFDVKFIREILGVRVSPLGVVDEPKFRIIHDLTFSAGAEVRSSVNSDTDFSQAPECLLGHVLRNILSRILSLRQLHGTLAEIMLCRVDVKEAFR